MDKYLQLVGLLVAGCIVLVLVAFLLGAASAAFRAGASKMDQFAGKPDTVVVVETATPRVKTAVLAGPPPSPPSRAGMATADPPAVSPFITYRMPLVVQMPAATVKVAATTTASPLASAPVDNWKQAPLEFNAAQKPPRQKRKRGEGKQQAVQEAPPIREERPAQSEPRVRAQQQRPVQRTEAPRQQYEQYEEPPQERPRQQQHRDFGSQENFQPQSWTGRLMSMGVETRKVGKDDPYDCYNVRMKEEGGGVIQQWGTDLERAVQDAGARKGNLIQLTHLGYAWTTVQEPDPANGGVMKSKRTKKKVFQIDVLG